MAHTLDTGSRHKPSSATPSLSWADGGTAGTSSGPPPTIRS
ncbi:hypothetical protein ACWGJB_28885 [Streptomyces sp. NPDC054813]